VFLPPGTLGSVLLAKTTWDMGNRADVAFARPERCHGSRASTGIRGGDHRARQAPPDASSVDAKRARAVGDRARLSGRSRIVGDALSGALMTPAIITRRSSHERRPLEHFRALGIHKEGTHLNPPRHRCADARHRRCVEALGTARRISAADHTQAGEEWMYAGSHDR